MLDKRTFLYGIGAMMKRVTHSHLTKACDDYNKRHGFIHNDCGYLQWADIFGSGIYRPSLWVKGADGRGLHPSQLQGATMRETLHNIQEG